MQWHRPVALRADDGLPYPGGIRRQKKISMGLSSGDETALP
jgi:hypothetical protein